MKRALLAAAILIAVPALGQEVKHAPKLAELQTLGEDSISVDGFWEPDNPTEQNELVPTATHIECYRHGGKVLVGTEAICMTASASTAGGLLRADSSLNSASWSNDEIVISDNHPICLISKTVFDLKRHTVTALDIRKPEAEGLGGACKIIPDRQTYYLRESVDYQMFHTPPKK
jgi:hypothetical protein